MLGNAGKRLRIDKNGDGLDDYDQLAAAPVDGEEGGGEGGGMVEAVEGMAANFVENPYNVVSMGASHALPGVLGVGASAVSDELGADFNQTKSFDEMFAKNEKLEEYVEDLAGPEGPTTVGFKAYLQANFPSIHKKLVKNDTLVRSIVSGGTGLLAPACFVPGAGWALAGGVGLAGAFLGDKGYVAYKGIDDELPSRIMGLINLAGAQARSADAFEDQLERLDARLARGDMLQETPQARQVAYTGDQNTGHGLAPGARAAQPRMQQPDFDFS